MAHKRLIAMSPGGIVKRMESFQFVETSSVFLEKAVEVCPFRKRESVLKALALHAFHAFHVVSGHVPMSFQQLPAASSSFRHKQSGKVSEVPGAAPAGVKVDEES